MKNYLDCCELRKHFSSPKNKKEKNEEEETLSSSPRKQRKKISCQIQFALNQVEYKESAARGRQTERKEAGRFMANNLLRLKETQFFTRTQDKPSRVESLVKLRVNIIRSEG